MKAETSWHTRAVQRKETRRNVLATIRAKGPLSRLDVSRQTNIRPSTVSHFVDALLREGFVKEVKRGPHPGAGVVALKGGRPPVLLELNAGIRMAIGIHVSRAGLRGLAVDLRGNPVLGRVVRKRGFSGPERLLADIAELARRIMREADIAPRRVLGLGLGLPGIVDRDAGIARVCTRFPWWRDMPVRRTIERVLEVPTLIENDTKVLAMAERWYGHGRGVRDMVFVEMSEGIAAGIVMNGELHHGAHGIAGELGHTVIDLHGPRCECGRRGCLESQLSLGRLLELARPWVEAGSAPRGAPDAPGEEESERVSRIAAMARAGHARARRLLELAGGELGVAIVNLIHLISPELIVLGGSLGLAWREFLIPAVERAIREQALDESSRSTKVVSSDLGDDAGARGAAALALATQFDVVCPGPAMQGGMR